MDGKHRKLEQMRVFGRAAEFHSSENGAFASLTDVPSHPKKHKLLLNGSRLYELHITVRWEGLELLVSERRTN